MLHGASRGKPQAIAGKFNGERLLGRDWQHLAVRIGLDSDEIMGRIAHIADAVVREADNARKDVEAMPAGGHPVLEAVCSVVCRRAVNIGRQLSEVDRDLAEPSEGAWHLPNVGGL